MDDVICVLLPYIEDTRSSVVAGCPAFGMEAPLQEGWPTVNEYDPGPGKEADGAG